MFICSLLVCSSLMGAVFAGNINKTQRDVLIPLNEVDISTPPNTTTIADDKIVNELEFFKSQYIILRKGYDDWMADPYHRNVVMPASIGAASALLTMIILCILFCWCKRCVSRRFGFKKFDEERTGWFGRRNTSHDS